MVTANTVNDARYNDAVTVSKHYNVALTPTTISTMPVLAEVTSGTAAGVFLVLQEKWRLFFPKN